MFLFNVILAASLIPAGMHSGSVLHTNISGSILLLENEIISSEMGSGLNPASSSGDLFWKECPVDLDQCIKRIDGTTVFSRPYFSGPFQAPEGRGIMVSIPGEILILNRNGAIERAYSTGEYPGSLTAGAGYIWFVSSRDGVLKKLNPETGSISMIILPFTPLTIEFTNNQFLIERSDRGYSLADTDFNEIIRIENGFAGTILENGTLAYCRWQESDGCETLTWDRAEYYPDGTHRSFPLETPEPSSESATAANGLVEHFDVPAIYQRWDTPDWFNGSWSCGPTSCMMAVQYYNRLTPDSIWCSYPSGHWSRVGNYIPCEYTFLGCTYDILGINPDDDWVPGAHGFICREWGCAIWAYMTLWMEQHGLESSQLGTTWSACTAELDNLWPVVASTTSPYTNGHILLFNGYYDDHSVVCNDAYGNQNVSGWGTMMNGKDVVYDWPGYNNGNTQLGISQLFSARSEPLTEAAELIDDRSLGYEKLGPCQYWHEQTTGYDGYSWWTYSTGALPDTCLVKWNPVLAQPGEYLVETYIPSSHSTATGVYHINTQSGWQTATVNQSSYSDQWAPLGTWQMDPATVQVTMGDYTGTQGQYISFDAVRFTLQSSSDQQTEAAFSPRFTVSCNPVSAGNAISFSTPTGCSGEIRIYDTSGRIVMITGTEIPAGSLSPGVYHAVVSGKENLFSLRITVLR